MVRPITEEEGDDMKVRHKPLVLDAFQWTGDTYQEEDPVWAIEALKRGILSFVNIETPLVVLRIQTSRGVLEAKRGDWIIKGVDGELFPCQREKFNQMYELLSGGTEGAEGSLS
jgi:hypothetical protein